MMMMMMRMRRRKGMSLIMMMDHLMIVMEVIKKVMMTRLTMSKNKHTRNFQMIMRLQMKR